MLFVAYFVALVVFLRIQFLRGIYLNFNVLAGDQQDYYVSGHGKPLVYSLLPCRVKERWVSTTIAFRLQTTHSSQLRL